MYNQLKILSSKYKPSDIVRRKKTWATLKFMEKIVRKSLCVAV